MTQLTATTDAAGTIHVSATDGAITIERKGKHVWRTIFAAAIALRIESIREVLTWYSE